MIALTRGSCRITRPPRAASERRRGAARRGRRRRARAPPSRSRPRARRRARSRPARPPPRLRRWLTTRTVRPRPNSASVRWIRLAEMPSTAFVASSRTSTSGSRSSARASAIRWRCAARQTHAVVAEARRVAVGQRADERVGVGLTRGRLDRPHRRPARRCRTRCSRAPSRRRAAGPARRRRCAHASVARSSVAERYAVDRDRARRRLHEARGAASRRSTCPRPTGRRAPSSRRRGAGTTRSASAAGPRSA